MTVKIDVKGPIISNDEAWIYDWFEMDVQAQVRFQKCLMMQMAMT